MVFWYILGHVETKMFQPGLTIIWVVYGLEMN